MNISEVKKIIKNIQGVKYIRKNYIEGFEIRIYDTYELYKGYNPCDTLQYKKAVKELSKYFNFSILGVGYCYNSCSQLKCIIPK